MANVVTVIKKGWRFLTEKLWVIRLDKLNKRQGFLVKQLRIFSLSFQGFNEDKCLIKATALTFYSIFSIVPIVALIFAIAKGFGFYATLKEQLMNDYKDYKTILDNVFVYADSMLQNANGGLIAGVGVVLLLWSIISLLMNIENSFNDIWEIQTGRTWYRKITDYLSIALIAPIFLILSGGLTVLIKSNAETFLMSEVTTVILKMVAFLFMSGIFTFLYMVLPNTRVNFKSAFPAALLTTFLFELLQWAYITFQIGASNYNKIYGSFAAFPLFLIWVQYSWYIVLFGAEMAFANQNVDHYELENEIKNISVRYKRVIALMISNRVVKDFNNGNPPLTAMQIAKQLDLPVRLARNIINELVETKIFSEVKTNNEKEIAYQPAIADSKLTIKFIMDRLDEKGVNSLPINDTKELEAINRLMQEMDQLLDTDKGNVPVKNIV